MKIIGIIPSRYASTRLPGKPLAEIGGKPMVQRVYEQAKRSSLITDVIVATDDVRIEEAVKKFGGNVVLTPDDIQSGSDRIALAARDTGAAIVVNIQGDEPLIDPRVIDRTIEALIAEPAAVVGTAVKRITSADDIFNSNIVKVVLDKKNRALYFSRSPIPHLRDTADSGNWLNETAMYKHFGLYVYRADFLRQFASLPVSPLEQAEKLEQLRVLEHGFTIQCIITGYESIPVDTPEDLEKVRTYF